MITLAQKLVVQIEGNAEYNIDPKKLYQVIGSETKDGKEKEFSNGEKYMSKVNLFAIINDKGEYATVYPSKCKVSLANGENPSKPAT